MTAPMSNQAQQTSTAHTNSKGEHTMTSSNGVAQDVGFIFVREYYTFLSKKPERLHAFYAKDSLYLRGDEGAYVNTYYGQNAIQHKIEELGFEDCKVLVTQMDSQPSANDGIIVQVIGEMCNKKEMSQKFCQTFFLARQQNGYHVLNDVFRFLREPMNIDYNVYEEDLSTPARQRTPLPPSQQPQRDKIPYGIREGEEEEQEEEKEVDDDSEEEENATPIFSKDHEPAVTKSPEIPEHVTLIPQSTEESKVLLSAQEDKIGDNMTETKSYGGGVNEITVVQSIKDEEPQEAIQDIKTTFHHSSPKHEPEKHQQHKPNAAKTWANLAADRSDKWGAQVAETKATVVVASGHPPTKVQQVTPLQQTLQVTPTSHSQTTTAPNQPSHPQIHSHNNRDQRRGEEGTEIFIKGVGPHIQEGHLHVAFSQFGTVKAINVVRHRNCAFLDFATTDAVHRALQQHKVNVGNHVVLAEERRHGGGGSGGRHQHNRQQQQNGRPFERRFQQDGGGHRRGGGAPRGGKSRGGGGGQK